MSISILMPVYNGRAYLDEALRSVVDQLGPDDEVVVQDANSTDGTTEAIQGWADRNDKVRLVTESDEGQTDALARALTRARGSFVGWLNIDDLVSPGALATVRNMIAEQPAADVVYGAYRVIGSHGQSLRVLAPGALQRDRLLRRGCYLFSGATYIRADLLRHVGFDRSLHYCMDFDLFLRLADVPGLVTVRTNEVLASFRYHSASKSGSQALKFGREAARIRRQTVRACAEDTWRTRAAYLYRPTLQHAISAATSSIRYGRVYSHLRRRPRTLGSE